MLNRREKFLIISLAVIVSLGVYYKFLMTPLHHHLEQLKVDKQEKEIQYLEARQRFASEIQLGKEASVLYDEILGFLGGYFGGIHQADVILLMNDFILDSNMRISSLSFPQPRIETFSNNEDSKKENAEDLLITEVFSAQINFESDYEGLIDFLRVIREYDKKIIPKNLSINNGHEGRLAGSLLLDFYSVPEVDKYFPQETSVLHYATSRASEDEALWNPFIHGELFQEVEEEWVLEERGESTDSEITEPRRQMTLLYGFESENTFFVGEPRDIVGMVSLDTNAMEGRYATKVQYDFIRGREYSVANLVFEGSPITIARQPEILALSIYAYETNSHRIGLVLIDSKGREFKISLAQGVDWLGWRRVETALPVEVTYPAVVQRIYMESDSFSDKLKGHFLFDKLEVAYPEVSSFSNDILGRD